MNNRSAKSAKAIRPPLVVILHRDPGTLPGAPILSEEEGWAGLADAVLALLKARRARPTAARKPRLAEKSLSEQAVG